MITKNQKQELDDNTVKKLQELNDKYAGKSIRIEPKSKHSHAGEYAEIIRYELDKDGEPAMKAKNDSGVEFYVYSGKDYYIVQELLPINTSGKTGRNQPCPCLSGKKYKHCCNKN